MYIYFLFTDQPQETESTKTTKWVSLWLVFKCVSSLVRFAGLCYCCVVEACLCGLVVLLPVVLSCLYQTTLCLCVCAEELFWWSLSHWMVCCVITDLFSLKTLLLSVKLLSTDLHCEKCFTDKLSLFWCIKSLLVRVHSMVVLSIFHQHSITNTSHSFCFCYK